VLALTATATDAVSDDIAKQLGVGRFRVVNTGMYRPNLHYSVIQLTRESEKLARAVELVRDAEGAGLVYAATVKAAEEVHAALLAAGVASGLYHGKMSAARRHEAQDAFMDGSMRVMVATNAFGLGIDKPDTRFVLHYQMPGGLDAYYQESGRAGRDGEDARCLLLFMHADKAVQQFFMAGKYPSREDLARSTSRCCASAATARRGRSSGCRRRSTGRRRSCRSGCACCGTSASSASTATAGSS
jgi:ATP-dependent DNA helicase RecQ